MSEVDEDVLTIWTIYHRPRDLPRFPYVARASFIRSGEPIRQSDAFFGGDTLAQVREFLPRGLTRLNRSADDDPVIVEAWL